MNVTQFAIDAARPQSIRVMQFGDSRFLRAFAGELFDLYNRKAGGDLGVVVVQTLPQGVAEALREQNGLYTVLLCGRENGRHVFRPRIVACVKDAVNPYDEWRRTLDLAKIDTLRYIISDTNDANILCPGTDGFDDAPPLSSPGKMTRFLYERFLLGKKGFVLLPCGKTTDNGRVLYEAVLKTAAQWALDDAFVKWLNEENVFCSTLADRAVTGISQDEREALYEKLGYTDRLLDAAEPFARWVIQAPEFLRHELPLDKCAPVIYTDDLTPYRLCRDRMYSGARMTMALAAHLAGLKTVSDCLKDEDVRAFLGHALLDEIMPGIPLAREAVNRFAADVCARFENPFNRRELLSLMPQAIRNWAMYVLPMIREYAAKNGQTPRCLTFGLTALILFYAGCRRGAAGDWHGILLSEQYPVDDDEEALIAFSRLSPDMPPESLAYAVLSDQALWGHDLRDIDTLEDAVASQLRDMQILGVRAAMNAAWQKKETDQSEGML